jgi:uncharacterized protein YkwD
MSMQRPGRPTARAAIAFVLLAVLLATLAPAATAAEAGPARTRADRYRIRMLALINEMRASRDLAALQLNHRLSPESWEHSRSMGRRAELFHTPDLASIIEPFGATLWGENVGVARTLARVLALMMASPSHRHHLVDPRLRWVGIGVVKMHGWLWITLDLHN